MRLLRALTPFFLLAPLTALAQYSIADVVFENPAPYTDAELLATSGFAPGQLLTHDSLANGGQHLLDTGLFADVQVSLAGQGKSRTVHVALKPTPLADLLPVGFENLVWFTSDELAQGLHARIPLYRGVAPEAGSFQDIIQTALQDMFKEKAVAVDLSRTVPGPSVLHPARVVEFRVRRPAVRLVDVHLSFNGPQGASTQLMPSLQKAVNLAARSAFNEGLAGMTVSDFLLDPVRSAGYATAHLEGISRTFAATGNTVGVTYTARIVSGDIFKVSAVTWKATPIYSAADFEKNNKLHPGDIASTTALTQTEAALSTAYLAHGYMDVVVLPISTLDDTAHTVAYTLKVIPGDVYRIGSVTVLNLSPEAKAEFDQTWSMKQGDPYNVGYVTLYLQSNAHQPHLSKYVGSYEASADPQTHLVDLTLKFTPEGR